MEYRHVQWGKIWLLTGAFFLLILIPLLRPGDEMPNSVRIGVTLFTLALLGVVVYASRLQVSVDGRQLTAAFGLGWPKKEVDLESVVSVRQLRNQWWYGFGVRKVPKGWMYNVWGLDAVELALADGKVFRIGTDDPDRLYAVLSLGLPR